MNHGANKVRDDAIQSMTTPWPGAFTGYHAPAIPGWPAGARPVVLSAGGVVATYTAWSIPPVGANAVRTLPSGRAVASTTFAPRPPCGTNDSRRMAPVASSNDTWRTRPGQPCTSSGARAAASTSKALSTPTGINSSRRQRESPVPGKIACTTVGSSEALPVGVRAVVATQAAPSSERTDVMPRSSNGRTQPSRASGNTEITAAVPSVEPSSTTMISRFG